MNPAMRDKEEKKSSTNKANGGGSLETMSGNGTGMLETAMKPKAANPREMNRNATPIALITNPTISSAGATQFYRRNSEFIY